MKKAIIGAAVAAAALAALRWFAPAIHERAMNKCHQMMGKCQEMLSQQAGSQSEMGCMSTTTPGQERAAAAEHEPGQAARAS